MRTSLLRRAVPLSLVAVIASVWLANAGDLDPPAGPISPTMKTLSEVEPRVAINATNTPGDAGALFRITQPGSYYLMGNITGESGKCGIRIESHNVTLDLMGYALIGVVGTLDGILTIAFLENVVIKNGQIHAWGESGIDTRIDIGRIERITASRNGAWGIDNEGLGSYTTHILCCKVLGNGILVSGTGGIRAGDTAIVADCIANQSVGTGISADTGCTVSGCVAALNQGDAIRVASDCTVTGNQCTSNGIGVSSGAGIHATSTDNRIEANSVTFNDRGIDVEGSGNLIRRNSASGNTTNYDIVASNRYGVIVDITAGGTPAVAGNSAASTLTTTDPWANFAY